MTHNDSDFKLIPFTNFRYFINEYGIIYDSKEDINISIDSDRKCIINIFDESRQVDQAWVLLVVFDPIYNCNKFILDWTVLRKNKNYHDISINNLFWKPPIGGQICPELNDFYIIPFYTRYAISRESKIFDRRNNKLVKTRIAYPNIENSYRNVDLRSNIDNKYSTIGVHRLMGLALLEYNSDINKLTINHRNGKKFINDIDNLEWMTYRDNNIHAKDNGLQNTRKRTLVKDYITQEITVFDSLTKAAIYININTGTLYSFITKTPNILIKNRYIVRYDAPDIIWPDVICDPNIVNKTSFNIINKNCWAYNIITDKIIIAETPFQLSGLINIPFRLLQNSYLTSTSRWPKNNYLFGYLKDGVNVTKFPPEVKAAFKNRTNIRTPLYVKYPDNSYKVYVSGLELSKELNKPERYISYKLKDNKGKPFRINEMLIMPLESIIDSLCVIEK